ncbi:MAG: ABC transporter ATP-binding protein [bacterium]|nr:ABC transporter ATP-binding protein [bacterium]
MKILKLENVSYKYADGNEYVLKDINFEFYKGKTYAVKGRSGSGKTTLLSLISGLEKCSEGNIYFGEKNLKNIDLDRYRSNNIGIVFQSFNLLPHLTGIENIILSMDISKVNILDKRATAIELLKSVGLDETIGNRRILKLSGGEQQRVAIARSLSYNPEIIIADEPTGNLDHETENEIMKIFERLAKVERKCIIIVTHSKNVSQQVDNVFELKKHK